MKSDLHKVLHPIGGRPMLLNLLANVDALRPAAKVVVVGANRDQLEAALDGTGSAVANQAEQLGTGHAVLQAKEALAGFEGDILILYGDVPFVGTETMTRLTDTLATTGAAAAVLGFRPDDPGAYGRILAEPDGTIRKMVEFKDASEAEREVTLCNSGLLAIHSSDLWPLLDRVRNDNAAGEYYLPDIVMLAEQDGRGSVVIETEAEEVMGVNSRVELAEAEAHFQKSRRREMMLAGVTLIDPDSVHFSHDTEIGPDVTIEPHVFFGPGVRVESGTRIRAFSHIEGAHIGANAEIGPFARLRPGAELADKVKIGNFVEVKKSRFGVGAKANHLAYIGDSDIGARANVGAGTITCNYDGFFKYRTKVGEDAFIGSNSTLVAPVEIGDTAFVAAGSVVTENVSAGALGVGRSRQTEKPGWATKFRALMSAKKKAG
jgi:bifunctional UDP-N-acetylglucosamine pyrophosphorylase/glucosamine-1-phosphate N-acetyltransferase